MLQWICWERWVGPTFEGSVDLFTFTSFVMQRRHPKGALANCVEATVAAGGW